MFCTFCILQIHFQRSVSNSILISHLIKKFRIDDSFQAYNQIFCCKSSYLEKYLIKSKMHTYAFADAFNSMCTKPDRHVSIFPNLIYKSSSNLCCTLYVHCFHFLHSYFRLKKGCYVILRLFCRYYLQDIPFE